MKCIVMRYALVVVAVCSGITPLVGARHFSTDYARYICANRTACHDSVGTLTAISHVGIVRGDSARPGSFMFTPAELTVPAGAEVLWHAPQPTYQEADSVGPAIHIIFDDPTAADLSIVPQGGTVCYAQGTNDICVDRGGKGNLTVQASDDWLGIEGRRFPRPGRYTYHSPEAGAGVIIVR